MIRFETETCVICESRPDSAIEETTYPIPGGVIVATFCSWECRTLHQDRIEENDLTPPYEQVARGLQNAGIDVEQVENGATTYTELWTLPS